MSKSAPQQGGMPRHPGAKQMALGVNPYAGQMFDRAADAVQGRFGSTGGAMGLSNTGLQQAYAQQLNDLATTIYGGAYDSAANRAMNIYQGDAQRRFQGGQNRMDRRHQAVQNRLGRQHDWRQGQAGRNLQAGTSMSQLQEGARRFDLGQQMQAALALPGMANATTQFGLGLGNVHRGLDQATINDAITQWQAAQNWPYRQLDAWGNALGLAMGAGGQVQTTYGS